MAPDRREFLRRAGALGASGLAARLAPISALAHARSRRRAVRARLQGAGVRVPLRRRGRQQPRGPGRRRGLRALRRGAPGELGASTSRRRSCCRSSPRARGAYGLHPALAEIQPLFAQGKLAVLANVGPLAEPTTRANYRARRAPTTSSRTPTSRRSGSRRSPTGRAPPAGAGASPTRVSARRLPRGHLDRGRQPVHRRRHHQPAGAAVLRRASPCRASQRRRGRRAPGGDAGDPRRGPRQRVRASRRRHHAPGAGALSGS